MIKFLKGDIFESKAQTLVATVNCVGIMGKGLAKEFRMRFPEMYKEYQKKCRKNELKKGVLFRYEQLNVQILCFPTKDNWKGPSKYEFIESGLETLRERYKEWGVTSLAIPPLGCGLGGLDWAEVKELIVKYLGDLPINIKVYEPLDVGNRLVRKSPFRKRGKFSLTPATIYTGEMVRIARDSFPSNTPIGRLLLQKIAFFSQAAGLPIKLKFTKYQLGPYDYSLKFNIDKLEGMFVRDISPVLQRSNLIMLNREEWLKMIENADLDVDVAEARKKIKFAIDFLKQFSTKQIELLSSVLLAWIALVASGEFGEAETIVKYIQDWKFNKFPREQIINAYQILDKAGWLHPSEVDQDEIDNVAEINL